MSDPKDIRPARGLWAAVMPDGEVFMPSIRRSDLAARFSAGTELYAVWPDLAARGWRIIRVDVIPSEEPTHD